MRDVATVIVGNQPRLGIAGKDDDDDIVQGVILTRRAIVPRMNLKAFQVFDVLERLAKERRKPKAIRCDNGPEFAGRMLDQWAYLNSIEIEFSRPGKPTDNAFCEVFNDRARAECLNTSWFLSMTDAVDRLEEWRCHYNNGRPHTSLGNLTPNEFARQTQKSLRNCLEPGPQKGQIQQSLN